MACFVAVWDFVEIHYNISPDLKLLFQGDPAVQCICFQFLGILNLVYQIYNDRKVNMR